MSSQSTQRNGAVHASSKHLRPTNNTRRITLIASVPPGGNEWRIVRNLHGILRRTIKVQLVDAAFSKTSIRATLAAMARQIRAAAGSDIVVIHSPFVLNFPAAFTAWLLRRRLIAFIWDSYPSLIDGKLYDRRLSRRVSDIFEMIVPRLATHKVVPTSDFFIDKKFLGADVIPFWTSLDQPEIAPGRRRSSAPFSIVFAGHIDQTRGLSQAVAHLDKIIFDCAEIHVFSRDPAVELLATNFEKLVIYHHGYLPRSELLKRMKEFDFGLVTLHPDLDVPGFPSKTLDYLSADLPVLYFGRPLPAFTGILEKSGAGIVVSDLSDLNLAQFSNAVCDITAVRRAFEELICAKAGAFDHLFQDQVQ